MNRDERARLSAALYRIHKPGKFWAGVTVAGNLHMLAGGVLVPKPESPGEMGFDEGMHSYTCCLACKTSQRGDQWPCETVKLLLEAGVVLPYVGDFERSHSIETSGKDASHGKFLSVNMRPDRTPELRR